MVTVKFLNGNAEQFDADGFEFEEGTDARVAWLCRSGDAVGAVTDWQSITIEPDPKPEPEEEGDCADGCDQHATCDQAVGPSGTVYFTGNFDVEEVARRVGDLLRRGITL